MRHILGLILILATTSLGSGFFGGSGGGGGGTWGSITGTLSDQSDLSTALAGKPAIVASSTDNAFVRFDGATGSQQTSDLSLSDIASNQITVTPHTAASTATKLLVKAGAKSTAGAGASLILSGGDESGSNDQGDVLIAGTANTTGNRPTFGSQTDGVGELGYCYGAGAYCRFRAAFLKTSLEIRDSGGSSSGFLLTQDGTDSSLRFFRSTAGHGIRIVNNADKVIEIQDESANVFHRFSSGNAIFGAGTSNVVRFNNATQTTVGSAGGASALPATPTGYFEVNLNGTAYVIPYYAKS